MRVLKIIALTLLLMAAGYLLYGGTRDDTAGSLWVREDRDTLSLHGPILPGDLDKFRSVFDEHVTSVIVNSDGGDVYEAIQIGMILRDARVTVIVRGRCLSSCANYLFTAGAQRVIDDGIVGFHGNANALTAQYGGVEHLLERQMPFWMHWLLSDADRREEICKLEQTLRWENEFFAGLGIDQELFTVTQRPDKGKHDGRQYAFLLPTASTFAGYGIRNVRGEQSAALWHAFEEEFSMRLLHD